MYNIIIKLIKVILFITVCYLVGREDQKANNYIGYIVGIIGIVIIVFARHFLGGA